MKNVKFWMAQIAMVAIVSLIFGSPVFSGPSDMAMDKANDNASFKIGNTGANSGGGNSGGGNNTSGGGEDPTGGTNTCSSSNLDLCTTEAECEDPTVGGTWLFGSICA